MREVINWPLRVWLLFISLIVAILISVGVVLSDTVLILVATTLVALTALFAWNSRLVISATPELLKVGQAQIEREYIREIVVLDKANMRFERGAGLKPRAFLALRFWIDGGMKVLLNDPRDPTPYWLVSTQNAEGFKEQLEIN